MNIRLSRKSVGLLALAAIAMLPGLCWAIFYDLGPSKDEWGLKYNVSISDAAGDQVNIVFTLASEGRLKPFQALNVIAFSDADNERRSTYDVRVPIELKVNNEGKRVGQVQLPKKQADKAKIRIIAASVDGKRYKSAWYYDIPLKKYLGKDATIASPPAETTIK